MIGYNWILGVYTPKAALMSGLQGAIQKFNDIAHENEKKLVKNPFSDRFQGSTTGRLSDAEGYGRPEPGSKTEKRGIKAGKTYVIPLG